MLRSMRRAVRSLSVCDGEYDVAVVPFSFFGILHRFLLLSLILLVKVVRNNNFLDCFAHVPKGSYAEARRRG